MTNEVRLIEITDEQLLAIKAMAYGCANNKRLVGASYMTDISTDNPKSIPFGRAWEIVQEFVDETNTIDPETLRPKGRWVNERILIGGFAEVWGYDCSVCGKTTEIPNYNYCPHCGARMEDFNG